MRSNIDVQLCMRRFITVPGGIHGRIGSEEHVGHRIKCKVASYVDGKTHRTKEFRAAVCLWQP